MAQSARGYPADHIGKLESVVLIGIPLYGRDEPVGREFLMGWRVDRVELGELADVAGPNQIRIVDLQSRGQRIVEDQSGRPPALAGHGDDRNEALAPRDRRRIHPATLEVTRDG